MVDSTIYNTRIKACDLARRSSKIFCENFGHSTLDSIAPFERDEIILGPRVGAGSFSNVYEVQAFNLRHNQSDVYTRKQLRAREAIAKSVKNGAKYVMKCLRDELLKESDDEDLFLHAAEDIVHEAEMLSALSHPNIVKLHGVTARRHDAFLDGASAFFIIIERLDCTLADTIEGWKMQNSSLNALSSLLLKTILFKAEKVTTSVDKGVSFDIRLRVAASLAGVVEYLHSQGVIFHDLKPNNVGFDKQGNLKCFDFGLARFIPQQHGEHGDAYEEVYEMGGAGTPRYTAPEVFFGQPYNLKADVYSFSVMLWEMMSLKKPFAKHKHRRGFEKALLRADKALVINRRCPKPIQDIITRGISRDLSVRPTMSEVCMALNECATSWRLEDCNVEKTSSLSSTQKELTKSSLILPARRLSSQIFMPKNRSSILDREVSHLSVTSGTISITVEELFTSRC